MSALLLPASARQRVPWKNGGGYTTELVIRPDGDAPTPGTCPFDWRLSIATVDSDGGFSAFPGVDRSLMALSPQGLGLVDNGTPVELRQHEVHRFAGENEVAAVGVTAPTLDLNLMTRRAACSGDLQYRELTSGQVIEAESGAVVVVLLSGELSYGGTRLAPHDAVLIDNGSAAFRGHAAVAIASIVTPFTRG
ncbi:HutD/Ves family protein [Arthrobacter sp. CAN_A1]|uniref:HutD/Ves family protein n=1 Tax=Arthrobacter sp. CAN_A1 TaxID=2787717 RepID=UPI0018CABFE8